MKPLHLLWVLGLALGLVACAAWTDEQVIQGCLGDEYDPLTGLCDTGDIIVPPPPTGGSGGSGEGACTNPDDAMVYANLEYTDSRGNEVSGSDAASAIASDCVFGSPSSDPPIEPGCGGPAGDVIACAVGAGCDQETIDALTNCVTACTEDTIADITGGMMLTEDCLACYGDSVSCSAENCAAAGCTNPNSQSCIQCRCDEDCTPGFDRCSGLPPSGACG